MTSDEADAAPLAEWHPMRDAPRDGRPVFITVRSAQQGDAEVDVASWSPDEPEGWRSVDSDPACVIAYAESELKAWSPAPGPDAPRPAPFAGDAFDEDFPA